MAAIRHSVRSVLLTNAAGCVWPMWAPGDMMLIRDHINLQGVNVLAGPWDSRLPERFVDLSDLYSARLRSAVKHFAADAGIALREGVYTGFLGPSYETKAEVRMARTLGGDAVGMSTVQEAIAARRFGAEVVGISVITNHAAGVSSSGLSHAEVKENAHKARERIVSLVTGLVPVLDAAAA
jgi:purine-nucleoside phosphorylase